MGHTLLDDVHINELLKIKKHIAVTDIFFVEPFHANTLSSRIFQLRNIEKVLTLVGIFFGEGVDITEVELGGY